MNPKLPNIKTRRLLLRQIHDADLENIYKGLSHPDVIKYYGVSFHSLEATKEQMHWFKQKEQAWFAICALDNQTFCGAVGLNDINLIELKAEIGLWLLPEFWGKGIMKEVFPLIVDYGLHELKLNRIEGFVESDNTKCKSALSKLDFQFEKTLKDDEIKNGKLISVDVYAKNK